MKKHIGKLIVLFGILMLYPLSSIMAPWITRILFSHRMPDGQIVILDVNSGIKGLSVCLGAGLILVVIGILIEVSRALENRKNGNPNKAPLGIVANAPNREG